MTALAVIAVVVAVIVVAAYFSGKKSEKADHSEKPLRNINNARRTRDKYNNDPEYRKRVHDKYTRK